MHKVIVIDLNGNAYQVDEPGYDSLRAYLDRAETQLKSSPDFVEIMADLEGAIGEKCQRFLGPHKSVVSAAEIDQILADMGPVEPAAGGASEETPPKERTGRDSDQKRGSASPPKRLYQIADGAMFSGVCNGIAAYFNVDVTIVRILFVILAFLSGGIAVAVYFVLMVVIPIATTSEEHAAAHGQPFNAQEVVDQARKSYSEFKNDKEQWKQRWRWQQRLWHRQFIRQQRRWRRNWPPGPWSREASQNIPYGARVIAGTMLPVLGIVNAGLVLLLLYSIFSVMLRGMLFGWSLPPDIPRWIGVVGVVVAYLVIALPFKLGKYAAHEAVGGRHAPWAGLLELVFIVLFFWLAYTYVPVFRDFLNAIGTLLQELFRPRGGGTLQAAMICLGGWGIEKKAGPTDPPRSI